MATNASPAGDASASPAESRTTTLPETFTAAEDPGVQNGRNPLTGIILALAAWVVILGLSRPWVSLVAIVGAWAWCAARKHARRVIPASLVIAAPVAISALIIHVPFGERSVGWLVTIDGLWVAAELGLRVLALATVVLAAMAATTVPRLAVALQQSGLGARLAYVGASSLSVIPEARSAGQKIMEAHRLRGDSISVRNVVGSFVVPLVSQLLSTAAARAQSVEANGIARPGPRTTYRPFASSRVEHAVRWIALPAAVALVFGARLAGGGWW